VDAIQAVAKKYWRKPFLVRFHIRRDQHIMEPNTSPSNEKKIKEVRAEFRADLYRDIASSDDIACLSTDEILALQSGSELNPVALEHLAGCELCSALRKAIEVDDVRLNQFKQRVSQIQQVTAAKAESRPPAVDWRLAAAAMTALASAAMVFVIVAKVEPIGEKPTPPSIIANKPDIRDNLNIAVPAPLVSKEAKVSDFAPQIATAVVLSKSEITTPANSTPQAAAAASKKAREIIHRWAEAGATASSFESIAVSKHDAGRQGFELLLPGNAVAWVPDKALSDGMSVNDEILQKSGKVALNQPLPLKDGSTVTLTKQ
jgi:hypothetical protein